MNQTIHTRRTINGLQLRPRLAIAANVKCTLSTLAKSAIWRVGRMTSTQLLGGVCRVAAVAYRYAITLPRPKPTRGDLSDVGSASPHTPLLDNEWLPRAEDTTQVIYVPEMKEKQTAENCFYFSFENVGGLCYKLPVL